MKKFFSIRNSAILLIILGIFYMLATFALMAAIAPAVHVELAAEFTNELANGFSGIYTLTGVLIAIATGGGALAMGVAILICSRHPGREMVCMILGAIVAISAGWSVISSLQTISLAILFPLVQAALGCIIFLRAMKQRDHK